ncbi:MAG: hypothetical protein HZB16_23895 [Armatimonadetes bacterium]|nr:hypothetical protein [Armatimonadota bacterium]
MQLEGAVQRAALPCPACGQTVRGEITILLDAQADPGCTKALLDSRVNRLRCGSCHNEFLAVAPVLYHDAARQLAVALVPPGLGDRDTLVGALVARLLEALGPNAVEDYLLEPRVVDSHGSLRLALTSAGAPPVAAAAETDHDVMTAFAAHHGAEAVLELLDLLGDVTDEDAFLTTVNDNPQLLAPGRLRAVRDLAGEADAAGLDDVAEMLGDLASLLKLHTPEDEAEDDLEQEEDELPPEVRDMLVAGNLEAAEDFLDKPDPRRLDDARRAVQTVELENSDRREGFMEHARLFGTMVDDMMEMATQDDLPDMDIPLYCPTPLGVAELNWATFVASVNADRADEVLAEHPDLVVPAAMDSLTTAVTGAYNLGDEAAAAHFEMLRNALLIAGVDEE